MSNEIQQTQEARSPLASREGETYRQYIDRLRSQKTLGPEEMAGIMAASSLMQNNPNDPIRPETVETLAGKLLKQPSLRSMSRDPEAQALARSGRGADLILHLGETRQRQAQDLAGYQRPEANAEADNRFLRNTMRSMRDSFASRPAYQRERESKRFLEFLKRLDAARTLTEQGVPLSGRPAQELAQAAQRYNDGGTKTPGGRYTSIASKEALCVMSRLMPTESFERYCGSVNRAQQAQDPTHSRHLEPRDYTEDLLTGNARTARDLMAASQRRLRKKATLEGCATVTAVMRLSQGNPNAVIRREALEAEMNRLKTPGSAFMRVMSDPTARDKYLSLAGKGKVSQLGRDIIREANQHSVRAAQWQMNRSVATLQRGVGGAEQLANVLAARELAANRDPGQPITNRAFQAKTAEILNSQGFAKLADRIRKDPDFRAGIERGFSAGDAGRTLEDAYRRYQGPAPEKQRGVQSR